MIKNKSQEVKKTIYILLTIFLGVMLSFILHAIIEVAYIKYALSSGAEVRGTYFLGVGWCALPPWVQYTLPVLGIVGGYFLGQHWWHVVYIQRRHWRFRKDKTI